MLSLEMVPYCRTLQVFNIGQLGVDSLSAYFENPKRSGGSGDVTVNINRQQGYAIVTFESYESKKVQFKKVILVLKISDTIANLKSKCLL